jgi:hypothetical protein
MGVVIGVIVGYAMGSRAGSGAWAETEEAWRTIKTSEEVQDLIAGVLSMARDLLGRRAEILASAPGVSDSDNTLHQVA